MVVAYLGLQYSYVVPFHIRHCLLVVVDAFALNLGDRPSLVLEKVVMAVEVFRLIVVEGHMDLFVALGANCGGHIGVVAVTLVGCCCVVDFHIRPYVAVALVGHLVGEVEHPYEVLVEEPTSHLVPYPLVLVGGAFDGVVDAFGLDVGTCVAVAVVE